MVEPVPWCVLLRRGASLSDESPIANENSSTVSFDDVSSVWSYCSDGTINIPQLRLRVLKSYFTTMLSSSSACAC